MTTNHRPTLESKRGKVKSITDSIVHARALPQSGSLKYRTDIPSVKFKNGVNELKRELLQLEGNDKKKRKEEVVDDKESKVDLKENLEKVNDVNDPDKQEDNENSESSDNEEEDSEDEETALLMAEIAKIRKERAEADKSKVKNPLVNTDKEIFPAKKSWRSSTFKTKNKQVVVQKNNDNDDTLDSEFHQKFLSKYVR
ncbi:Pre-mRNA-splicing factor CWC15 [Spathaspora sp. JA1]|nr:Pre-mRNA-splicing factor CWC15 [Spathaspora sp. JA1]